MISPLSLSYKTLYMKLRREVREDRRRWGVKIKEDGERRSKKVCMKMVVVILLLQRQRDVTSYFHSRVQGGVRTPSTSYAKATPCLATSPHRSRHLLGFRSPWPPSITTSSGVPITQASISWTGAAGEILRNSEGAVVMVFAHPLESTPSTSHVELQALTLGLKACLHVDFNNLLMKADFLEMINRICLKEIDSEPENQ